MSAPPPPADLAGRTARVIHVAAAVEAHRFHSANHDPIHFDRGRDGRLNAPDGRYGVLYLAQTEAGAFAETFLRSPGRRLLPADLLARKAYARLRFRRNMTFIALTGPGLAVLGATAEVTHGGLPYDAPQAWSAGLYDHPLAADGIAYTARHDDQALCLALFERAAAAVEVVERRPDLDEDWFWGIAERYGVGLAP